MKIGIFDSGLGGLVIAQSIMRQLPDYDYIYLGDTLRVPYGNRSEAAILQFTEQAVDYLCKQDCQLIIVACNTVSAKALRTIQQHYLPGHYPDRCVLGVIIPTVEELSEARRVGIIATTATVRSKTYPREIAKLFPKIEVVQAATPLLVPLIENQGQPWLESVLRYYLEPLVAQNVDTLILGCTHYALIKEQVRSLVPQTVRVLSQDEIIPLKLEGYMGRHPEIGKKLSQTGKREYFLTDSNAATGYQTWLGFDSLVFSMAYL